MAKMKRSAQADTAKPPTGAVLAGTIENFLGRTIRIYKTRAGNFTYLALNKRFPNITQAKTAVKNWKAEQLRHDAREATRQHLQRVRSKAKRSAIKKTTRTP